MGSESATSFSLGDLSVFDEAHLRQVIASVPGAVPPALAGCAFATDRGQEPAPLTDLAELIERALAPSDRAVFIRARQQVPTPDERESARRSVLDHLYWELTYWKTPEEYERLTAGEQVHLGALDFAHVDGAVVLDAGAGTGRATLPLAQRARLVYAMDPALPLLRLLEGKLASAGLRNVELLRGVFRRVPLPDDSVDAVVSCSAFGLQEARGGQCGLNEFQRVTRPGGRIVIMWPEDPAWFVRHGFHYTALPGHLAITFSTLEDALVVAHRFYGAAAIHYLETTCRPELPFHVVGVKAPRDLCWLTVRK
jgi:ubiquinone/menaquinone biosynthesis C-methylase UbiE